MIVARGLVKHYRVHSRPPGLAAALRSVFRRRYETVRAVDDVSFSIASGERVAFLGPNGAGKTTTLKMLAGLLHPTSGEAQVLGHAPARREHAFLRSIMLVTGQKQQLLWDLPPSETFELNRAVYDVPRAEFRETLDELVSLLDLSPLLGKPTRQLSLGERMKCELAAALIHRPKVLFLDEPTIGLDVTMQANVRAFIKRYNEKHGATVLLTSHYMEDVLAIAPRVIVIDHGKLSFDGSLDALVRKVRPERRLVLRLRAAPQREHLDALGAKVIEQDGETAVLQADAEEMPKVIERALARLPVVDLSVESAPLEEVLSDLFARSRGGQAGSEDAAARAPNGPDASGAPDEKRAAS